MEETRRPDFFIVKKKFGYSHFSLNNLMKNVNRFEIQTCYLKYLSKNHFIDRFQATGYQGIGFEAKSWSKQYWIYYFQKREKQGNTKSGKDIYGAIRAATNIFYIRKEKKGKKKTDRRIYMGEKMLRSHK